VQPQLVVASFARANREMLENALAGPIRALSYNALPFRFRGRMRALLEGVVFFGTMSVAGATLLLFGERIDPSWLAVSGACAAFVYALANMKVRREYLRNLIYELREGRLDFGALSHAIGTREFQGLAEHWERTLDDPQRLLSRGLLELAGPLAMHGFAAPIRRHLNHSNPRVRLSCLRALAEAQDPELSDAILHAMRDPEHEIRRLAASSFALIEKWVNQACRWTRFDINIPSRLRVRL
jgi:hypothetical protein